MLNERLRKSNDNAKWWIVVVCCALAHLISLVGLSFYILIQYYEQPNPFNTICIVLASPAYFFFPVFGQFSLLLLLPNSLLWGCALAEPIRWWCGWAPWRYSLRTLLIAMTVVAALLGIATAVSR